MQGFMRFYGEEVPVARNRVWGAKSTPCGAKDVKSIGSWKFRREFNFSNPRYSTLTEITFQKKLAMTETAVGDHVSCCLIFAGFFCIVSM